MPPIRSRAAVPPSQWDRVYGNGDGRLSPEENAVGLFAELVLAKHPIDVDIRTDAPRDIFNPFRAGVTYRDDSNATQIRIYPRSVAMNLTLVPYVVSHEIGHAALGHLDRPGHSVDTELEADRFAGRALAEIGEPLEDIVAALKAAGGNADTHGTTDAVIAQLRAGYAEGLRRPAPAPAPAPARPAPAPAAPPRVVRPAPSDLRTRLDRLTDAFDAFIAPRPR